MTKLIYNAKQARIEAKDGRKVAFSVNTALTAIAANGIIAGFDGAEVTLEALQAAVAAAEAKRGSIIPQHYRERYGADQNCGDKMATLLTEEVTDEGKVNATLARNVAVANGVEDRFDVWLTKGLNPGQLRMNLGNVLRGKLRRGELVTVGDQRFNVEQPVD